MHHWDILTYIPKIQNSTLFPIKKFFLFWIILDQGQQVDLSTGRALIDSSVKFNVHDSSVTVGDNDNQADTQVGDLERSTQSIDYPCTSSMSNDEEGDIETIEEVSLFPIFILISQQIVIWSLIVCADWQSISEHIQSWLSKAFDSFTVHSSTTLYK